jgi:protoporphyrinogen oxidase
VGGGPAGLAVAHALQGDTLVLERETEVGGLCRSIEHKGGVFDIGGHSFHTPHPGVASLLHDVTDGGLYQQTRDARVYAFGTLIPYPFQRFYELLPRPDIVRACADGLTEEATSDNGEPSDFEEYIRQRFGHGIAEHFMLPYNRKLWARDIKNISCEWTAERIAAPKGDREKFEDVGGKRRPLQPDTRVGYPVRGGFQEIFRGLAGHVPAVETNAPVARIVPDERIAVTTDSRVFGWDTLVTTIPLPELVKIVDGMPERIRVAAAGLDYMSLRVELILVGRRLNTPIQRIYSAEADIPPHKIALNHNSSDSLRRRDCHAIMAEVSVSPEKVVDVEAIAPRTVDLLCEIGVLDSAADVAWTGHVDVQYAYPVYTHERPGLLAEIKDWLRSRNIHTVGRFGDWEYVNSDRCVHKGLELGRSLRDSREQ